MTFSGSVSFVSAVLLVAGCTAGERTEQSSAATHPSPTHAPMTASQASPPTQNDFIVRFEPVDGTSSTSFMFPRLNILGEARVPTEAALKTLVEQSSLVLWPEGTTVQTEPRIEVANVGAARIEFRPASPLADRWYALRVASLPAGFGWPRYPMHTVRPDGVAEARFNPGSAPEVWGVGVCTPEGGAGKIIRAYFSEAVILDDVRSQFHPNVNVPCRLIEPAPAGVQKEESNGAARIYAYSCDGDLPPAFSVSFGGWRSVAGARFGGRELPISPNAAVSAGPCQLHRAQP